MAEDDHLAFVYYQKAALQGDGEAQNSLGHCYEDGSGCEQNYEHAAEWFEKAALQGDAGAQCSLGVAYEHGRGVAQNDEKAFELYNQSAGVPQNDEKAFELYNQSAAKGNSASQYNLGCFYRYGHGCEQNYKRATEWYAKAALQGNARGPRALGDLGSLCYDGTGVPQNRERAVELYRQSASIDEEVLRAQQEVHEVLRAQLLARRALGPAGPIGVYWGSQTTRGGSFSRF